MSNKTGNKTIAAISVLVALPATITTTNGEWVDLGEGLHLSGNELKVTVPDLLPAELADTKTMTYSVEFSDDKSAINQTVALPVQIGAGGSGKEGEEYRIGIGSTAGRYARLKVAASAAAAQTKSAELEVVV